MRIVGGTAKGRRILIPKDAGVRPTPDKIREAVFMLLRARDALAGARVLDLFAGSGALGLEALSHGASQVHFVDQSGRCLEVVRRNLAHLGFASRAVVIKDRLPTALARIEREAGPFDLVFLDPPYATPPKTVLQTLRRGRLLSAKGWVVLEHSGREEAPLEIGQIERQFSRVYGDTAITLYSTREPAINYDSPVPAIGVAMERVAVYPGSFDPITNGHLDILQRAVALFDRVVVAVVHNPNKAGFLAPDRRAELIREVVGSDSRVEVDVFSGLLVDYVREKRAKSIVRGLRAVADFEFEFQMASMNRHLAPDVDTVFLVTDEKNFYVSSSLVKEVSRLGGNVSAFVPQPVVRALRQHFGSEPSDRT
jgi:pantetheine-phosphate adenylyltransferase